MKKEATKLLVPGTLLNEYHKQVGKLMEEQLVNLKLISLDDIKSRPKLASIQKILYAWNFTLHWTRHP